jgi:hypothetical protein
VLPPFCSDISPLLLFLLLVRIAPLYICSYSFTDEVSQLLRHPRLEIDQKPRVTAWYPEHHNTLPTPDQHQIKLLVTSIPSTCTCQIPSLTAPSIIGRTFTATLNAQSEACPSSKVFPRVNHSYTSLPSHSTKPGHHNVSQQNLRYQKLTFGMCRVDERVYVRADGHRSQFQDTTLCDRGKRRGKMCSKVDVRRTEYPDPSSSPITSSPITPNYHTQARRPSVSSRPSTREGSIKSLKPEIHIGLTLSNGTPHVSITTGKSKRESSGSTSAHDSAGSEASGTVRTGYPNLSPPFPNSGHGSLRPQAAHYRNPSSDESVPGSSRMSHVYRDSSDYDTPSLATGTTASSSGTRPVIHHAPRGAMPAQINTTLGQPSGPASPYRTTEFAPRSAHVDGSYAPEIIGRDEDRQRQRDERRKQQEANDREVATKLAREENRRVHFEPSRTQACAEERADKTFAGRADGREQLRPQESKARAAKEAAAKEPAAREAPAREALKKRSQTTKPAAPFRRNSVRMSSTEAVTQQHLIDSEARQMRKERAEAEDRDREEALYQHHPPTFQQQPDSRHYDQPAPRRTSVSNQARPDLSRSNSKRGAAPQPRESRREPRQAPMAYYNTLRNDLPQAREPRRPSSSHANRPVMPSAPSSAPTPDPWDVRNMRQALPDPRNQVRPLPDARGPGVGHNFPQPHAGFPYPQQASHRLNNAMYTGEYESDSEDDRDLYSPRRRH